MELALLIAIASLLVLVVLHELGHFLTAKAFGVKVEEFGIGIPPRLFGVRVGETLYSLNLLPLGAFVRMEGEEERVDGPRSFSMRPVWQRLLIVIGGVVAFWLIAAVILGALGATAGIPAAVGDEEEIADPRVQIIGVAADSPAQAAGLRVGDVITRIEGEPVATVGAVQSFAEQYQGRELSLAVERKGEVALVPRSDPPAQEGPIGIALARVGLLRYPWYQASWEGIRLTGQLTSTIVVTLSQLAGNLATGRELPPGVQVAGPIGIVGLAQDSFRIGASSFLYFVALISIHLAVFNVLPIPALDGGRALFLLIEGIRRRPLSEAVEQRAIALSFGALILLIIAVSIMDITRLF